MSDLTAEERDFLVGFCMEPKNTWLALAVGQVQLELKTAIVSSFVEKLDESVKGELERRGLINNWKRTIPKTNLEKEESIYVMTMKDRGVEIQLVYYGEGNLYVGTPVSNGDWPIELAGFLEREDLGLITRNRYWHWWFNPAENHRSIGCIETLSKLNDDELRCEKIAYFTAILVNFAKALEE